MNEYNCIYHWIFLGFMVIKQFTVVSPYILCTYSSSENYKLTVHEYGNLCYIHIHVQQFPQEKQSATFASITIVSSIQYLSYSHKIKQLL